MKLSVIESGGTVKLEADGLARELGEGFGHLTIKREAQVGVDFFLKLEELLLRTVPKARLDHDEDGFARLTIHGEGIKTARVLDTEGAGFGWLLLAAWIAHSAKG